MPESHPVLRWSCAAAPFLAASLILGGCTPVHNAIDQESTRLSGAAPLDGKYLASNDTVMTVKAANAKEWIGDAAVDSITKCQQFVARMAVGRTAPDVALDITSLGLAGASAITVPLRSAQTLAALAGISSGARTAIDTDIFAQNTAPVIVQQIDQTYFADMKTFLTRIAGTSPIIPSVEYANLLQIHSECSLPLAVANIGKNVTAANTPAVVLSPSSFSSTAEIFDLKQRIFYGIVQPYLPPATTVTYVTWTEKQTRPAGGGGPPVDANTLATQLTSDGFIITKP